jgi:hypothetical protein
MVDLVLVVEEKHNIECPTLIFWVVVNVSQACGTDEYIWVVVLTFFQVFGMSLPLTVGQLLFLCLLRVSRVRVSHCGV